METSAVELSKERSLETAKASAVRILHVDDDAGFLKTAKQILEMQGAFQVDTASSIEEAMEKMKKEEYDLVVSDYQMPEKDGLQFLRELRKKGNTIPFIMFTGKGREEVAMQALNLGADGYFNKSGHPETTYGELAHGMRQVVDKRRAEQSFLKSEEKYRRLVETSREGIWVINKDSRTAFVNPRMAEMLGYGIEEMIGRPLFSFMDERGVETTKRLLERRRQGIKEQIDSEFLRKDGTHVYATLETSPITDDNGSYIGALASVMDTTERKKVEEEKSRLFHDLQDRVKELSCLYGMSRLVEKSDISLDDVLQGTVDLLPPAMRYPDIVCARVVVENREFSTKNFKETGCKLQADIEVNEKKAGYVEVCYFKERPTIAEGPFLKEEKQLKTPLQRDWEKSLNARKLKKC
jgi:PAS domain S-box-containing protein